MRPLLFLYILGSHFASAFSSPASFSIMRPYVVNAKPPLPVTRTLRDVILSRGGALNQAQASSETGKCPFTKFTKLASSIYGTGGVLYILSKAIRRVAPVAMEPFAKGAIPLTQLQLGSYVVTCLWFAYVEGYKGFQTKFAPLVVSRSFTMDYGSSKIHHFLLAPFYSMGLFHATKKRMIVSWSVSLGVAGIVYAVKKLPYPWRNIVDAGVVVGLTWGSVSIVLHYIKALVTGAAPADPALPTSD
ncbi:hypothetical protein MHU86_6694 [Fragilaria crotonensis]|nr:hypothetical protein MHU86_6694 [Fragilaria crotonensis]